MSMFHMWVVAPLPFDEGKFIASLKDNQYTVSSAAESKQYLLTTDGSKYGVIACKVEHDTVNVKQLYDDVSKLFLQQHTDYYSIVISEFSPHCVWDAGNVIDNKLSSFSTIKVNKNNIN